MPPESLAGATANEGAAKDTTSAVKIAHLTGVILGLNGLEFPSSMLTTVAGQNPALLLGYRKSGARC